MPPTPVAAGEWMSAAQAADRLGVSRATLYAYVSRGLLRSLPAPGGRASRYRRSEVERLALQHARARQPRQVAVQALDWGLPVLQSRLTLISDGRFHYRGQDAVALAAQARLEDVAALLWDCPVDAAFAPPAPRWPPALRAGLRRLAALPLVTRQAAAWALLTAEACVPADETLPAQAGRLLRSMAVATTGHAFAAGPAPALHTHLRRAWGLPAEADEPLRRALVLCADHELNASSFTARCVAATGAELSACVGAGLAALSGPRHGGMTARVEALWPRLEAPRQTERALRRWMQDLIERRLQDRRARGLPRAAGDLVAGFGHPLYPAGDPRAQALLALLPPDARRDRFVALAQELTGQPPALDFALVALRRTLGAPEGAAFTVFALARTAGWIAHALEQRADGQLIRPRAAYVGPLPQAPAPSGRGRVIRRR